MPLFQAVLMLNGCVAALSLGCVQIQHAGCRTDFQLMKRGCAVLLAQREEQYSVHGTARPRVPAMPTNVTAGDALVEAVGRNSYEDCLRALGDGAYVDHLASEHSAYTGYTLRLPLRA